MKILAIEQSTPEGSVAVLNDSTVLAQTGWHNPQVRRQYLFSVLAPLLEQAATSLEEIEGFAVGTGPGSFSGVRTAISIAQGFALPRHLPLIGVGSAEALALAVARESGANRIVIVGDARRNLLWAVRYDVKENFPVEETPLALMEIEKAAELMQDSTVISPDWDRIGESIEKNAAPTTTLIRKTGRPDAGFVGILAAERIREGNIQTPKPLYLHPAVFIPPKFPAA